MTSQKGIKVCHVTTVHGSLDNRIFEKECQSLKKSGFDVYLIAAHGKNDERNGIHIIDIRRGNNRLFRMLFVSTFSVLNKAFKVNADIYHLHDPELIFAGLILRFFRKKVIYDAHENTAGSIRTKYYLHQSLRGFIANLVGIIENTCSSLFSGIVAARPDIISHFKNPNQCLVRNFPILSWLPSKDNLVKPNKPKKSVVYVGSMTRIRGIVQLVEAFDKIDDAELWLLGPFQENGLKEQCESSPGWRNVRYLGAVTAREVFGWIKQADIGIVTFLPAPNHYTTLATKPFEYMACGLPLIMSDFPYWRETFKDLSFYVDPTNPKDIQQAIKTLLADERQRKIMGEEGQKKILQEFNWENEGQRLTRFYHQILAI